MIQKITPKKFVSDKDERLVAANEMILAENVTVSERADGSSSILKTMKGTSEIAKGSGEDTPVSTWKVVGTVTDNQRSRVYAFVYDTADSTDHRIIMSEDGGAWETVFKDGYLKFDEDYPVKADLINKAFQQDGNVQTVMYFTDNNNPPRKINIDRAIAGDYTDEVDGDGNQINVIDIDLDYAILTMRGAPVNVPTFSFAKDPDVTSNNFTKDTFQFACQYLYKDGEESALSGYSALATSPYISSKSLVSNEASYADTNVCLISIPWKPNEDDVIYSDVVKVRLLARSGNSNPFFIIDEFDPNENLTRDVGNDADKEVYNAGTAVYRFYNDGYYANISESLAGKLYDNVPQKAEGQTIAASRLLYSNYEEGYPNYNVSSEATISVNYGSATDFGGDFLIDIDKVISYPVTGTSDDVPRAEERGEVHIDLRRSINSIAWPNASDGDALDTIELPEGTNIRLDFKVDVTGEYWATTGYYYGRYDLRSADYGDYEARLGDSSSSRIEITDPHNTISHEVSYTTTAGETAQDVYDALKSQLNRNTVRRNINFTVPNLRYRVHTSANSNVSVGSYISVPPESGSTIPMRGDFYFGTTDTDVDGVFRMFMTLKQVYVAGDGYNAEVNTDNFYTAAGETPGAYPSTLGTTILQGSNITQNSHIEIELEHEVEGSNVSTYPYIKNREGSTESSGSGFSFKHGSTHELGIVYYDKWGRSGFVNKLGSTYVQHPSERLPIDNKGGAAINVSISDALDSSAPTWADTYQFVYGGSQYSNVFQYTTGGGYMAMTADDSVATNNALIDTDHKIYVSLNSLSQFKDETGSLRDYSYTEGDICRVISYEADDGTTYYPSANDGSIIEFEVAGVYSSTKATGDSEFYDGSDGNPIQWNASASHKRGDFLVLRAPRVDGNSQVKALKLVATQSILSSSSIANGTADTSADTSDTVTVTRDGVDITSELAEAPSFSGIVVTGTGTSLDAIVVNAAGDGIKAGDVITFSCTSESSIDVTIIVTSEDLNTEGLKYKGFDWYSVCQYWEGTSFLAAGATPDYPDSTVVLEDDESKWGQKCVIEILTPKKVSETPVYYEIGERIKFEDRDGAPAGEGLHGPAVNLTDGDVQIRPVSCRGPVKLASANADKGGDWTIFALQDWDYNSLVIENQTPGEFITEKAWGKGRVHTTFERAATVNRYNSITYSQPYADDTSVLALSSFVPSQINFFDLPSEHGACTYLGLSSDQLVTIQENKVSRLGLNKDVLETGTQAGVVTISSKLINNLVSYAGDYGTSNPESVLIRDGIIYFVDVERRAIVKLSSKGLEVISNKDISSTVEEKISSWEDATGKTIVSGYDPEDNIYYVTLSPQGDFTGYTLGYDEKGGFWQGSYTFYPDRYAMLKDRFFALKYGNDAIIHEFKDTNASNRFFSTLSNPVASKIRVVSNANPSMMKTFQAISIEAKQSWSAKILDSDGRESDDVSFSKREDAFYGSIGGIKTYLSTLGNLGGADTDRQNDDIRYLPLGTVESATNSGDQGYGNDRSTIVLENSLRGMSLPLGYELYYINSSGDMAAATSNLTEYGEVPKLTSVDRSTSTVVFEPAFDTTPANNTIGEVDAGTKLFIANSKLGLTSERIRDRYAVAEISITPSAGAVTEYVLSGEELYAINFHFSNSPLNDAIG